MHAISRVSERIEQIETRIAERAPDVEGRFGAVLDAELGGATDVSFQPPSTLAAAVSLSTSARVGARLGAGNPVLGISSYGSTGFSPIGATPAEVRSPGNYGPLTPPAELASFGNGTIPSTALAPIGVGEHRLWSPAAQSFQQMNAAARAEGINIGVTDSYRSIEGQRDVAAKKGLYSQGGLAATPGTSNHGWGMALDLDLDSEAQAWMRANGPRFGFVEDVPREPWHWTYRPASL